MTFAANEGVPRETIGGGQIGGKIRNEADGLAGQLLPAGGVQKVFVGGASITGRGAQLQILHRFGGQFQFRPVADGAMGIVKIGDQGIKRRDPDDLVAPGVRVKQGRMGRVFVVVTRTLETQFVLP